LLIGIYVIYGQEQDVQVLGMPTNPLAQMDHLHQANIGDNTAPKHGSLRDYTRGRDRLFDGIALEGATVRQTLTIFHAPDGSLDRF
jgi:hypothetical protein